MTATTFVTRSGPISSLSKLFQADLARFRSAQGYISLFPVLLGLLKPDSPHLGAVLELMRDPSHLWSPYGLRSLSKQDASYGKGENYWKGPIWMPMNYMALQSLYKVTQRYSQDYFFFKLLTEVTFGTAIHAYSGTVSTASPRDLH